MESSVFYMNKALELAQKAFDQKEVPVGALIVKEGRILAQGFNTRETSQSSLGHAELLVIEQACQKLKSWRLNGCELYVTLEPCLMCFGACLQARISHLVYGARDLKKGFDSFYKITQLKSWKEDLKITSQIEEGASSQLLKKFFLELRQSP